MARVAVKQLCCGAVLAADVADRSGRVLLRAGCEISERHVKTLKSWGIVEVEVQGEVAGADAGEAVPVRPPTEHIAELQRQLRERFRHVDLEQPFMQALLQEVTRRLTSGNSVRETPL